MTERLYAAALALPQKIVWKSFETQNKQSPVHQSPERSKENRTCVNEAGQLANIPQVTCQPGNVLPSENFVLDLGVWWITAFHIVTPSDTARAVAENGAIRSNLANPTNPKIVTLMFEESGKEKTACECNEGLEGMRDLNIAPRGCGRIEEREPMQELVKGWQLGFLHNGAHPACALNPKSNCKARLLRLTRPVLVYFACVATFARQGCGRLLRRIGLN